MSKDCTLESKWNVDGIGVSVTTLGTRATWIQQQRNDLTHVVTFLARPQSIATASTRSKSRFVTTPLSITTAIMLIRYVLFMACLSPSGRYASGARLRGANNDRELELVDSVRELTLFNEDPEFVTFRIELNLGDCRPRADLATVMLATLRTGFMDQDEVEFISLVEEDAPNPARGRRALGNYSYVGQACNRCRGGRRELVEDEEQGRELSARAIYARMRKALKIALVDTLGRDGLRECLADIKEEALTISAA